LNAPGIDVKHEQSAVEIGLEITLLRLQDFEVLA